MFFSVLGGAEYGHGYGSLLEGDTSQLRTTTTLIPSQQGLRRMVLVVQTGWELLGSG